MEQSKQKSPELLLVLSKFGTLGAISGALGISKAAVSVWRRVPVHHVRKVCELTGLRPDQVRPDIFAGWNLAA